MIGPHVQSCWFGGRAYLYGHSRRVTPDEGNRLGRDESRQVDKLQMDAVRMNPLEGVGETASSPQFKRACLEEPLDSDQEKTGEDETKLIGLEDVLPMKSRGSSSLSTVCSILDRRPRSRDVNFINYSGEMFPWTKKWNVFNGTSG